MRAPVAIVAVLAASVFGAPAARAETADVLIQAGHEGRPASCAPLHVLHCNLGAAGGGDTERAWTPVVADAATAALRASGLTVLRRPADYAGHDDVRAAVFLHFDGDEPACRSGASIGFPATTSRDFLTTWERSYRSWTDGHIPFVGENITKNESEYYGFRKVDAPEKMLIEFGEITCADQRAWMAPRLTALGERVATFLIAQLRGAR